MCRKISSHWQPLFSKKMAAASFSYKIGGGGLIFLQNWWRWPHFHTKLVAAASFSYKIDGVGKDLATLLAAVLTWSGYWFMIKIDFIILFRTLCIISWQVATFICTVLVGRCEDFIILFFSLAYFIPICYNAIAIRGVPIILRQPAEAEYSAVWPNILPKPNRGSLFAE